jgi:radical SAM protein with 4Fe4S-binding SPASM domain
MPEHKVKRYATQSDYSGKIPVSVVWEITLACNLNCQHCGSRAGKVRPRELSVSECFDIIGQLKRLGTRDIGIIGGEAFLKKGWLDIIEKITQEGMDCAIQTGAYNFDEEKIILAKKAGIKNIGVSIDGLEDAHDSIRGKKGSFRHAVTCLQNLKKHNIPASVNTVITNRNKEQLEELMEILISCGAKNWQLQFAVAMGNAVNNDDLLVQPYNIKGIIDKVAGFYIRALANNLLIQPGNNFGYFGPHEYMWRAGNFGHFEGCSAGHTAIGLEADGTIKGCPSLPTKDYAGGNVRDLSIKQIWENSEKMSFTRHRNESELWGFCKTCYYASTCMAGCTWTGHVLFGRRGNNPYCYHRVSTLEKAGKRERIRKTADGEGKPFDYGMFELITETLDGEFLEVQQFIETETQPAKQDTPREVKQLELCNNCKHFVHQGTQTCPFCNEDIALSKMEYNENFKTASELTNQLSELLGEKHLF